MQLVPLGFANDILTAECSWYISNLLLIITVISTLERYISLFSKMIFAILKSLLTNIFMLDKYIYP